MIQKFTIAGRLCGLNEYTQANRSNPHVGAKLKKEQQEVVRWNIRKARLKSAEKRVFVTFQWFEKNSRRDPDNVAFAKKFILDALVDEGVIQGDGWKHVSGLQDEFYIDKVKPRIVVTLAEVDTDNKCAACIHSIDCPMQSSSCEHFRSAL